MQPNQTLQQIQSLLLAQHDALNQSLDDVTDPVAAKTIVNEMTEILHRINMIQNLLFAQASAKLDATLPGITQANSVLTKAIADINNIATFLGSITKFLQAVDQAIDIAKTLITA